MFAVSQDAGPTDTVSALPDRQPRWPRLIAGLAAVLVVAGSVIGLNAQPAQAARTNPNPILWTVYHTFYVTGEDIPLRYGQHDAGPVDGFGTRHIEDGGHKDGSWSHVIDKIETVLEYGHVVGRPGTTVEVSLKTGTRVTDVIYSTRVDPASRDGRPVGIITAYSWCTC